MKYPDIKMGHTGFNPVWVLSFENEKAFLEAAECDYFKKEDPKKRKIMLKEVYQKAKALVPATQELAIGPVNQKKKHRHVKLTDQSKWGGTY